MICDFVMTLWKSFNFFLLIMMFYWGAFRVRANAFNVNFATVFTGLLRPKTWKSHSPFKHWPSKFTDICVPQSINFIVLLPKKDAFCTKLRLKDTLSIKLWPKSFLWSNIEFWRRLNGLFLIEGWNPVKITMTTEFRFVQVNANPNTVSCKKPHAHFLSTAHSVVRYNLEVLIHHCRTAVPTMSYPGKLESPSVISNWNS